MRCAKCGNEFDGNFCSNCGAPAQDTSVEVLASHLVDKSGNHIDLMELAGAYETVSALRSFFMRCTDYSKEEIAVLSKYIDKLDGNDYGFIAAASVRKRLESAALPINNDPEFRLELISGQQALGSSYSRVLLLQNDDGLVYFKGIKGLFNVIGYEWAGPNYETVSETVGSSKSKGGQTSYSNGREKRTGRLTGALVGTMILPGAGTLIGAIHGTGNKKTKGTSTARKIGTEKTHSKTREFQEEVSTPAYMTLQNVETGKKVTIGFQCDTQLNGEMLNVLNNSPE